MSLWSSLSALLCTPLLFSESESVSNACRAALGLLENENESSSHDVDVVNLFAHSADVDLPGMLLTKDSCGCVPVPASEFAGKEVRELIGEDADLSPNAPSPCCWEAAAPRGVRCAGGGNGGLGGRFGEVDAGSDFSVLVLGVLAGMGIGEDEDGGEDDGGCGACNFGAGFWCCELAASMKPCTGDEVTDAGREKGRDDVGGDCDEGGGGPDGFGGS